MKIIKKVFNFYIFSNIHVALSCFCFTKLSLLYWQNNGNTAPIFVFFATLLSYNYIRLTRINQIKVWLYDWIKSRKKSILTLSILSFLGCVYLLFNVQLKAFLILIPFGFLTLLYVMPPVISKKINLRNLPAFKIFIIALSWAGITVLFPLLQQNVFSDKVLWLFVQRFLFVVALTLPFDIRDVQYDSKSLMTLPLWIGVKNSKILGLLFLSLSLLIEVFIVGLGSIWITIFVAVCLAILLLKASTKQNKYYSAFWLEGIPIMWLGLYILFT